MSTGLLVSQLVPGPLPGLQIASIWASASYADSTIGLGGASFESTFGHAAAAIQAGLCKVAVILYGSTKRSRADK